jgi:hypothetical protein
MKKITVLFFSLCFGVMLHAQTAADAPVKKETKEMDKKQGQQNPAAYACPKCFQITKGSGKCQMCKIDKVQLGTYYCPKCIKATGTKAGTCPVCKTATVQMTRKYCAKMGGTPMKNENGEHNEHKEKQDQKG